VNLPAPARAFLGDKNKKPARTSLAGFLIWGQLEDSQLFQLLTYGIIELSNNWVIQSLIGPFLQ
jgi:hypothetical protein